MQERGHRNSRLAPSISTNALSVLLNSGADVVILDARTPASSKGPAIPGAIRVGPDPDQHTLNRIIGSGDRLVVIYSERMRWFFGMRLSQKLARCRYRNVREYADGIDGWIAAGCAVEDTAETPATCGKSRWGQAALSSSCTAHRPRARWAGVSE